MWDNINKDFMVISGKILAETLERSLKLVKDGVSSSDLDFFIERFILSKNAIPSFKGFNGYPAASCISINDEVVHGLPDKNKVFRSGDLVTVDIGVSYKGHCTDAARTLIVGREETDLISVTRESLYNTIKREMFPGKTVGDIGFSINMSAIRGGFSVPLRLGGHGIGLVPHLPPFVANYGVPNTGEKLTVGMYLAVEPILFCGSPDVILSENGWTYRSTSGVLSAHFEETIYISKAGPDILTNIL